MIFFGALGSIVIGCFGALIQRRIKRFLAYTSINQVGFLLLGLGMCDTYGLSSAFLFLFIYLIMNIIFFCLVLNVKHFTENIQLIYLTDLYSLSLYDVYFGNL
jgi:NADH-quinone oxidoreductase subunit N